MPLADLKAFFRWLDESSKEAIMARRDQLRAIQPDLTEHNAKNEVRFYLRHIENELLSRVMNK